MFESMEAVAGEDALPADCVDWDAEFAVVVADARRRVACGDGPADVDAGALEVESVLDGGVAGAVAGLLQAAPGGVLAAAVQDAAAAGGLGELGDVQVVRAAAACQRLMSWACGVQLAAMAELAARWGVRSPVEDPGPGRGDAQDRLRRIEAGLRRQVGGLVAADLAAAFVVAEVALACGVSEYVAGQRLDAALAVYGGDRLPGTRGLLEQGRLDWPRVAAIVTATQPCQAAAAARVEAMVIDAAPGQAVAVLRRALAAAVLAVDPDAARRAGTAVAGRRVACTAAPDGMGEVWALLPADGMAAVQTCLGALAAASLSSFLCAGRSFRLVDVG